MNFYVKHFGSAQAIILRSCVFEIQESQSGINDVKRTRNRESYVLGQMVPESAHLWTVASNQQQDPRLGLAPLHSLVKTCCHGDAQLCIYFS